MNLPDRMAAVLLLGHGGTEMLEYRENVAVPQPAPDEVLINVLAAGINNTDINTRIGWYSKTIKGVTDQGALDGFDRVNDQDASWSGDALHFPRIQGADACGRIVAVGANISENRIGERVLVRSLQSEPGNARSYKCWTFGSECDGGFAQFATARSTQTLTIQSHWSDQELASMPCAYSTAENMLHRVKLGAETVLISGASGGVGSAAVQLAKRRGAKVIALTSASKSDDVLALGADQIIKRNADLVAELGNESIDVVVDLVAGEQWPSFLEVLKRGGRYVTAGAIAGPLCEIDIRTLYLKDLILMGCTFQEDVVFENLIRYIEADEIKPLVAATYPLSEIADAQEAFVSKQHTGKLVLIPPAVNAR